MAYTKFNWVYRQGAAASAPVPSFYTCTNLADIDEAITGDLAYIQTTKTFYVFNGAGWDAFGGVTLDERVAMLEFYVILLLQLLGVD